MTGPGFVKWYFVCLLDWELFWGEEEGTTVSPMFTVVALGPVACKTNGTGSQLTTVNIEGIIIALFVFVVVCFLFACVCVRICVYVCVRVRACACVVCLFACVSSSSHQMSVCLFESGPMD